MPDTPTGNSGSFVRRSRGYPGRDRLDAASMRFRRAVARLHREGQRSDPQTAAKLGPIVAEAEAVLLRLAERAEKAENESARNRRLLAEEEARLDRLLRRAARRGLPVDGTGGRPEPPPGSGARP
ncbi:hypothetical protein [Streptomyces aidingensis]|uniref:Uncharacterized protein n=1 Tax=Streptomyces aidingensis TaxID=910347 RepID=A0A1I1TZF1_9ACTN|nr:hypothetical protein [Streptomyces aidingensis]SFD61783.1 hypothetical protein SAMN05421773_12121 [Streptomyces aidingensis]